jgi:hypothetical protein
VFYLDNHFDPPDFTDEISCRSLISDAVGFKMLSECYGWLTTAKAKWPQLFWSQKTCTGGVPCGEKAGITCYNQKNSPIKVDARIGNCTGIVG